MVVSFSVVCGFDSEIFLLKKLWQIIDNLKNNQKYLANNPLNPFSDG